MNRNLVIAALLLVIISCSPNLSAQDKLTPEEMFRWFPEGKYEGAMFKDGLAARTMPGFAMISSFGFTSPWLGGLLLPEILKTQWSHMVEMNSVKIVVSNKEDVPEVGRAHRFSQNIVGDMCYVTNHFGYKMQVIRFPPELDLKKIVLSQKGFLTSEYTFNDLTVYFDKSEKKSHWSKEDYYFCITAENEILACVQPKLLKKMVKTGSGEIACVVDDFPFPYLIDLLPDLNHYWLIADQTARINALKLKLEKDEVSPEDIEKLFSNKPYYAHWVWDYSFDKNPVFTRYTVFEDEESALSYFQKRKGAQLSQKDRFVSRSLVYTDELIERISTQREEYRKESAKKENLRKKQQKLTGRKNR